MARAQRSFGSRDLRKHPRAPLHLPVRIRWHGSLGTRLETTHTINVSREGLLVRRAEPCEVETRVWVLFPYEPQGQVSAQPETPATVVRVDREPAGAFRVALRLEGVSRQLAWPKEKERRQDPRVAFALPIFVRPLGSHWPEESMTRDISRSGARFETSRTYALGDEVLAKISWGDWDKAGEIPGRVVRVEDAGDSQGAGRVSRPEIDVGTKLMCVAVQWMLE